MPTITKELLAKRAAMVRTGGKGTMRRTTRAVHKPSSNEDAKVSTTLKRLGVSPVADVTEAVMFKADGNIMTFKSPKVQASMQSQCFVVSGAFETKSMAEVMGAQ
eukprot:14409_1